MKKAEEFIDISKLSFKSKTLQIGIIEEWVKQAQIDAIEEAVKRCAANADAGCDFGNMSMKRGNLFATFAGNIGKVVIDKQSILEVAEQLRKEIE